MSGGRIKIMHIAHGKQPAPPVIKRPLPLDPPEVEQQRDSCHWSKSHSSVLLQAQPSKRFDLLISLDVRQHYSMGMFDNSSGIHLREFVLKHFEIKISDL